MKRSIARGRVFPQSFSTDRRYGRLSLKAVALFPLMWSNADDQGRLCGDPEEIKYTCCPNIDHITKADIPEIIKELEDNKLLKLYDAPRSPAIQLLDWWGVHRPQWAWPSEYPPPGGWEDKLRYKKSAKEVVTFNWFSSGESSGEQLAFPQVRAPVVSGENEESPLTTPLNTEKEKEKEKERGRSPELSPERSGEKTSTSPTVSTDLEKEILDSLTKCFKREWGRIEAKRPDEVIPREPTAKESAQLRDLAKELAAHVFTCPAEYIFQAFREAAGQGKPKENISYVRAILFDWLGIERNRSP